MRQLAYTVLFVSTASAAAPAAGAGPLTLERLRNTLAASPVARWRPVGQLPAGAASFGGGALIDEDEVPATWPWADESFASPRSSAPAAAELPRQLDWRDRNGVSYLPSAKVPQGTCGSCVSFATMAALEARLNYACDTPHRSFDLSRQFFFSCGGGLCRQGWRLSNAVDFLTTGGGVPDTPCMPYSEHDAVCSEACEDAPNRKVRGVHADRPTAGVIDVLAIKQALLGGPLVSSLLLFEDLKLYEDGVYRHVAGNQIGSHAVVLVGWNDDEGAWIARNSWGETWGDAGYFKVAWDDVSLPGRYTWAFDVGDAKANGACALRR